MHRISLINLYTLKFLESLDAGLHLIGLGGLVTEGLNKLLGLLYHLLLIFVCGRLLGYSFLPESQILAIRHLIVVNMAEHNLHRTVGDIVQKAAVVAHQQQGATFGLQVAFEPFDGLDI